MSLTTNVCMTMFRDRFIVWVLFYLYYYRLMLCYRTCFLSTAVPRFVCRLPPSSHCSAHIWLLELWINLLSWRFTYNFSFLPTLQLSFFNKSLTENSSHFSNKPQPLSIQERRQKSPKRDCFSSDFCLSGLSDSSSTFSWPHGWGELWELCLCCWLFQGF